MGVASWALQMKKNAEYYTHGKPYDHPSHFSRVLITNGHMWRLLELHANHVKKSKFLMPSQLSGPLCRYKEKSMPILFYEDYEHMLGVVGLIRFALQLEESMVARQDMSY